MRKMKDSGIEWIGKIPDNWKVLRLKNILSERKEKNNPIKTDKILSLTNDRGVIPYSEKGNQGNKAKEDLSDYKIAYPNDIVLNSMNVVIGSVGISKYFGCVSPVYYMLYTKEYNIKYYNYIFQTKIFQDSLKGLGNGILEIRMRIPMEKLNNVILPIPNITEQEKIANFLDSKISEIDKIIEKTKETIEDYKKYKQAVIANIITKGLDENVKYKDTGIDWIGKIPEKWELSYIRYLGKLQNGISKSFEYFGEYKYPFVSYGDVYNNYELPKEYKSFANSSEKDQKVYSVKYGDVFFTRTSEIVEEIAISSVCLENIKNAVFSGFLIRFRVNNLSKLDPQYAKYYFRSNIHRKFFAKEMNIITRASLGQDLLKRLPVILPSIKEQKQIGNYLDNKCLEIDKLIENKDKIILQLEEYKKSLIYEYVTGKKRSYIGGKYGRK